MMVEQERAGEPRHRDSLDNGENTASGATVIETGRAAFYLRTPDLAMPNTLPLIPQSAADNAAVGGWFDPDRGTRWEGLHTVLPRFRKAPIASVTLSGKGRASDTPSNATPDARVEKAKRRNVRKETRATDPDWRSRPRRHKPGLAGLLAAIKSAA